jgi:hypothetical protein
MRVELRDGQWAELHERLTHAEDKALKKMRVRGQDDKTIYFDWQTELVRTFTKRWHVLDRDGQAIPLEDADAIEQAPSDITEALFEPASDLYLGATVPNSPTPPLSDAS